uniref:Uncharacterized protein n=1 Tax=Opuntia streptacantha TaxID=393608 RepID=A0A7C9D5T5_OPUST
MSRYIVGIIFDISTTRMENKDDFIFTSTYDLNQTLVRCLLICSWGSLHVWEMDYGEISWWMGSPSIFNVSLVSVHRCPLICILLLMSYIWTLHIRAKAYELLDF